MSEYIVSKGFKANGKVLNPGDPYELGSGMHDDKLISQRYIVKVDPEVSKAISKSMQNRNEARQVALQPDKYTNEKGAIKCEECDFEAKSKAGLAAHMRAKHQEE